MDNIHKKIRMLNKGSASLDKILSMGRTEKSTIGLGYQGYSSSSQTIFVRGKSVEQNNTRVDLDDECSCVTMSGPLEWIDAKEDSETGKLHSIINANRTTLTKDINLTTSTYICGTSLVASLTFLARPWKYGKRISYDSFRNTYDVAFKGTKSTLVEETMDLVRPNKEIGNLSSPLCLFTSAMFRSGSKLLGKASLQNFVILGADVSYYHHDCSRMHLDNLFVGKRKQKIQVKRTSLLGSVVFYVGDLMALQKHVKVQIITCLVIFTICLCLEFCSRWKHKDLKRRRAFGMIQFIWGFGAYETFEFLRCTSSNVSCTPLGRMTITSTYGIVWSSAVWSLSHMAVTIPYVVFPFKWLQVELQLEVSKRKVKVVHSPQTGLGRIFIAIICWFDIACESSNLWECSNSAFQHVGEGATYFPIFSTLPSSSTKFSRVVWAITRSVGRELICGVMINIFRSTQHHLPKKNARQILFDYVTGCTFHVGWVLIHSVLVSYESLELRGEKNCSCPSERRVPAKGYFWIIAVEDKAFHRGCAIVDGKLQLVQAKKGVWVAYLYGSRTLFVIIEVKIFSFVRPPWSFLALESVYSHSHLLPFISSFHCGLLKRELDVVLLVNLEFVVVNLTASSAHMDVVESDFTRDTVQVIEFAGSFSQLHDQLLDHLKVSYAKYKAATGWHRRDLQFYVGAYVWAVLTKECFVSAPYNHFKVGKMRPLQILEKINVDDRLVLPPCAY